MIESINNENWLNSFLEADRLTSKGDKMLKFKDIWKTFGNCLTEPIDLSNEQIDKLNNKNIKVNDEIKIEFIFPFSDSELSQNNVTSVKVLKILDSNAKPIILNCLPMNKKLIYKRGDNLYDEQIVMAYLHIFNQIWQFHNQKFKWKRENFNNEKLISNLCYKVVPISNPRLKAGFIEFVEGSETVENLYNRNCFYRPEQHKFNDLASSLRWGGDDYVRICASAIATFVSMFVLAIGDRHQGNIMLAIDHTFFNIDFGYSFGESVFLNDTWDFPIPFFLRDYLRQNEAFDTFIIECWNAMQTLKDYTRIFEILAGKFMKDPIKFKNAKNVFLYYLNANWITFKFRITVGSYAALPKYYIHNWNRSKNRSNKSKSPTTQTTQYTQ